MEPTSNPAVDAPDTYDLADFPAPESDTQVVAAVVPAPASAPAPEPAANTNGKAPAPAPAATAGGAADEKAPAARPRRDKSAGPKLRPSRRKIRERWAVPAWLASFLVHVGVLGGLALAGVAVPEVTKTLAKPIDAAPFDTKVSEKQAEELLHFDTEVADAPRDQAVTTSPTATAGAGAGSAGGSGMGGGLAAIGSGSGSGPGGSRGSGGPGRLRPLGDLSGMALMPAMPTRDLGGGGMIAGDVTYETKEVGEALSQIAREILRHVAQHKVVVVWLFDESGSMRDDQRAVKEKFDRVVADLKIGQEQDDRFKKDRKDKSAAPPLTHVVVGFGAGIHFELEKPTADVAAVGRAIDRLHVDETGVENTLTAVQVVIGHYEKMIAKDRRLLIVLATDESGDDGAEIEEARQAAIHHEVPVYVLGRQSLFGYPWARLRYEDPVTKDVYWPQIRRGPETADLEVLQWDGYRGREDELPAGFAPYELARLAKDTGGIYFLLPDSERQRVHRREKAYSMATLKEYVPEYESRAEYLVKRNGSEMRRIIHEVVVQTKDPAKFSLRLDFPVEVDKMVPLAIEWAQKAAAQELALAQAEKRLRQLEPLRDREIERRWQAHYDLILAQIVARQVKIHEYRACLAEMVQSPPVPDEMPRADLAVYWWLDHGRDGVAPPRETEKYYAEATKLLQLVISRHPDTPWADLARAELDRGLSTKRYLHKERPRSPDYAERAKMVPKY